jgi:hypothetical protein
MELMPPFWDFMMASLFRVENPRLRQQLWQQYPKSSQLRWQLRLCGERAPSELAMYERLRQLCQHLDPATLLRVAEGLAPLGRARPRDIIAFEETVLKLMDKHGQFKWLPEEGTDGHKSATAHRPA